MLEAGGWEAEALEDEDKAWEAKKQILYGLEALWGPFWCPNPSKILCATHIPPAFFGHVA